MPNSQPAPRISLRTLLWLTLVAGYFLASLTGQRALAVDLVSLMLGALCWVAGQRVIGVLLSLGLIGAEVYGVDAVLLLAYLPPLAAFSFMAWFFGKTLQPGIEPLITRVARQEHPDLPVPLLRYTRALTRLWFACFLTLLALALVLAPLLALATWSRWVQALGYLLPCVLFLGEYVYRLRRFATMRHASIPVVIANSVRVIRQAAISSAAPVGAPNRASE